MAKKKKKGFADVIKILDFESLKAENLSQGGQGLMPHGRRTEESNERAQPAGAGFEAGGRG